MCAGKLFPEIPSLRGGRIEIRALTAQDADSLRELVQNPRVYRYLPAFLFERKYPDVRYVIDHLYADCARDSVILGIYGDEGFCGLAELYGYREPDHKISVGYRLLERCWGRGIATEALGLIVEYLFGETDIEIIAASTMIENKASANVLRKNGFSLAARAVPEDWGYAGPTLADKWIRHGGPGRRER